MSREPEQVIFFADVVGSTRLYESLGDALANECVVEALQCVSDCVTKHQGDVVEIIGDEVMAMFAQPAQACLCACDVHRYFASHLMRSGQEIRMRIGFHRGEVGFNGDHPFGDTVNLAARLSSLAEAGQSVTSAETVASLVAESGYICHPFGAIMVKGKSEPVDTMKVEWDIEAATALIAKPKTLTAPSIDSSVELRYGETLLTIQENDAPFTIGRAPQCSHTVTSASSSRSHLSIELRYGKWVLVDRSTNGTYIQPSQDDSTDGIPALLLHHAEWVIEGSGLLGLGKQPTAEDPDSLAFTCRALAEHDSH